MALLEDHAGKRHRRTGFRRERLAILEMFSLVPIQKVNQGIEGGETTDLSFILIFRDFVEKAGGVQRCKPLHQPPVLSFHPLEKIIRNRLTIAELLSHMREIDTRHADNR